MPVSGLTAAVALTRKSGASWNAVLLRNAAISASTAWRRASSTRSTFVKRDGAASDSEELQDGDVLACLRHDAVVRGDHQQREVNAAGARSHGMNELLMPGTSTKPRTSPSTSGT